MGGFSYSDMLESARGWAATILAQQRAEGALRERVRGEVERHHAAGHGGLHAGRVGGARRGPLLLARRRGEGGGDAAELRGAEVRGRRRQRDDGVPDEPERLRGCRGGSDLARRPPPVHNASPRASVHEVLVALLAGGVGEPRVALAEDVPERERVVRASVVCLLNMLNKEATRRGRTCAFSCPYERAAPSRPPDPSPEWHMKAVSHSSRSKMPCEINLDIHPL